MALGGEFLDGLAPFFDGHPNVAAYLSIRAGDVGDFAGRFGIITLFN